MTAAAIIAIVLGIAVTGGLVLLVLAVDLIEVRLTARNYERSRARAQARCDELSAKNPGFTFTVDEGF